MTKTTTRFARDPQNPHRVAPYPIEQDAHGADIHPSWVTISASRYSSTGTHLFDSEIPHREFVSIKVMSARRTRNLHQDWISGDRHLVEIHMSLAQWGAFVSSFGTSGVPATLSFLSEWGGVPPVPEESRLGKMVDEIGTKSEDATAEVRDAMGKLLQVVDGNLGKKALRDAMETLSSRVGNLPSNMKFAADSLIAQTEEVVQKARYDIESMVTAHAERLGLSAAQTPTVPELSIAPPIDKQAWLTSVVAKMNETGGAFEDSVAQAFLANVDACVIANKNHARGWLWVKLPDFLTQDHFEEVDPSDDHYVGHDGQREHDHPDVQFEDTRCSMCMHAIGPVLDEDDDGPRERWITCFAYNSNGHGGWVEEDFLLCEDCLADLPEGPSER